LPLADALWCQVEAGLGGNMEAQVSI
jgi:hypothetical protein